MVRIKYFDTFEDKKSVNYKFIPETDRIKVTKTHPVPDNSMTRLVLWFLAGMITNNNS